MVAPIQLAERILETERIIAFLPKIAWPKSLQWLGSFRSLPIPLFKTEIDSQKVLDLLLQILNASWGGYMGELINAWKVRLSGATRIFLQIWTAVNLYQTKISGYKPGCNTKLSSVFEHKFSTNNILLIKPCSRYIFWYNTT